VDRTQPPSRHRITRSARWLAAAVIGLALMLTAGVQAQAASATAPAAGTLAKPARIPLNTANWSGSAGFGSRGPAWYTDGAGVVHLQGAVRQTSSSGINAILIGTLPKAARPAATLVFTVHTFEGTYAGLEIVSSGQILAEVPFGPAVTDFSFVSLEGITYRPPARGTAIALNTANWSLVGLPGTRRPAWYTDGSGVVHLQGVVHQASASGANANLIGTLPAAIRPADIVYTIVNDSLHGYADLAVGTDGTLRLIDPRPPAVKSYDQVSLESISYRPTGLVPALKVNTANWTANAGFGSGVPAVYTDRSGIVHMEGAAAQISASGPNANLIATLPAADRPAHIVYVIVHTFEGTYTDLAIGTDGTIRVIPTRLPLVTDFSFVSLESVTYRR
jgi:hypothetical protein